jgi:hypothetical protein
MTTVRGEDVRLCNTGGWLFREMQDSLDFVGAEIMIYETGKSIRSESILADDLKSESPGSNRA